MKLKTIVFSLMLFFLFNQVFAYDYCFSGGWGTTGCGSCNDGYECGTYCYVDIGSLTSYKNFYNLYLSGQSGCSATSGWVINLGVSQQNQMKNILEGVAFTQGPQPQNINFNNANTLLMYNNETITLYGGCTKAYGGSGSLTYSGMSITQICFDHYYVQLIITDGTNPISNANVSYYFFNNTHYRFIDSKLTDNSGSALIETCFNCIFKINVTASGFESIEKVLTITSNVYTINLKYEASGFNSLWEHISWKIEPLYQYLPKSDINQTINLTVYSTNNTLEYFSLNLTSINTNQQLFFNQTINPSGGTIYGSYNNTFSNVTLAKIKIKAVGFNEIEIVRLYYSYETKKEYDYLTIDGILKNLSSQKISVDGMDDNNSTKLFFGILASIILLVTTSFVGINFGSYGVFGSSIVGLIVLSLLASYSLISWGVVVITGVLVIGLSLIFSGLI